MFSRGFHPMMEMGMGMYTSPDMIESMILSAPDDMDSNSNKRYYYSELIHMYLYMVSYKEMSMPVLEKLITCFPQYINFEGVILNIDNDLLKDIVDKCLTVKSDAINNDSLTRIISHSKFDEYPALRGKLMWKLLTNNPNKSYLVRVAKYSKDLMFHVKNYNLNLNEVFKYLFPAENMETLVLEALSQTIYYDLEKNNKSYGFSDIDTTPLLEARKKYQGVDCKDIVSKVQYINNSVRFLTMCFLLDDNNLVKYMSDRDIPPIKTLLIANYTLNRINHQSGANIFVISLQKLREIIKRDNYNYIDVLTELPSSVYNNLDKEILSIIWGKIVNMNNTLINLPDDFLKKYYIFKQANVIAGINKFERIIKTLYEKKACSLLMEDDFTMDEYNVIFKHGVSWVKFDKSFLNKFVNEVGAKLPTTTLDFITNGNYSKLKKKSK